MYKVAALIKRKPGLSRAEFMEYYERSHAPLARKCFPQIVQYRRNFIDLNGAIIMPGMPEPDFDSVTEIWYRDREAYDEMLSTHFMKGVQETIENDERNFLDQTMTRMIKLEEHGAKHRDADLRPSIGSPPGAGLFKVMALLTCKPGLPRHDFIHYYEHHHAPLLWSLFPWFVEYRRNFLDVEGAIVFANAKLPDFDVITELWFENRAGYERMLADHENPEVSGAIARDEENCFDRTKTRFFVVEEAETPAA
jgi:uncharacterized protein (TIGR02118 family)